jgi:hypothetical protein
MSQRAVQLSTASATASPAALSWPAQLIELVTHVKPIVTDKLSWWHLAQSIAFGRHDRIWIVSDNLETKLALAADIGAAFALVHQPPIGVKR